MEENTELSREIENAEGGERTNPVYPEHVARELARISGLLSSAPDPFHHAGLYAAQQALCWAAQPEAFASPVAVITGSGEGRECCSAPPHPKWS